MNQNITTTFRKINNLLSSGSVTVSGSNQPRILKHKVAAGTTTVANSNSVQSGGSLPRCYVCDEALSTTQTQHQIVEMTTSHTSTRFPQKLGQLVGEAFMVIVGPDDLVCSRCTNLVNYWDRLENDVERVRTNLINLLHKKYGINDDSGGGDLSNPPLKVQKLATSVGIRTTDDNSSELNRVRKVVQAADSPLGKQTVSAVHQMKVATPVQQSTAGTQTVQRKATKIYKCTSCDYKTSDMRLFNTHFETCKHQTFQCKTCKRIFQNFGSMKQHMVRDHNTPMDNTCAVCHINFANEGALRKHMELIHATNVLVTSTTTIPASAAAPAADSITAGSPLYTCNHCHFKSTDKPTFDEHMRKHLESKPKPFKCRLCSQRFETREAATVHAKQHQTNYFKCGTCAMSFPKREMLVKHFEVHQTNTSASPAVQTQKVVTTVPMTQPAAQQPVHTTQKLLQETIDEALRDSVASGGEVTADNNIRFFSCQICSLTFLQEYYFNHHMETHRRDNKTKGSVSSSSLNSAAAALLTDETSDSTHKGDAEGGEQNAEADIESIFEKMHSDKEDGTNAETIVTTTNANTKTTDTNRATTAGGDNLVITSQEGSGGITFNITIPQPDTTAEAEKSSASATAPVSVSIDMPVLDQPEEESPSSQDSTDKKINKNDKLADEESAKSVTAPVSMPSLDDDNDAVDQSSANTASSTSEKPASEETKTDQKPEGEEKAPEHAENTVTNEKNEASAAAASAEAESAESAEAETHATQVDGEAAGGASKHEAGEQQVAIELDESMHAQVEGGQIKFIMSENGHLLQLDNHIITDAEGNQIIVQDPEQIQQLLQSVGVLQSGEGLDGETIQMMTDANGQMVLVQGENNESQLIDASLLNSEGQLIIQQGQDENEGPHVISEDGTRIPVSVSYTADGQPIVQVQQQVLEAASAGEEAAAAGGEGASHADESVSQAGNESVTVATSSASGSAAGSTNYLTQYLPQFSESKAE